ncbi:BatA domain-containing protein [Emticicia aquatilis]|uniref:BatA domain-containing protein n=1 Tax=Emticicia aquatilis TaxID=1537369 RepID=UPI00166D8D0F|nr:BatA domain-containing protein [Emticicia aquatilis]
MNPYILWGSLAISIPIVIHFWHQKKGKVIAWAATQWLSEKNLQQSRGIRLDNILLLIIRCLLLLLLVFILSKPLIKWAKSSTDKAKIHLIQPNQLVVENYKFEIEEALKRGEKCYWLASKPVQFDDMNDTPQQALKSIAATNMQIALNEISHEINNQTLELYFVNQQSLAKLPAIFVPTDFKIHSLVDSSKQTKFLSFSENKRSYIDEANLLKTSKNATQLTGESANNGVLKVGIFNTDANEKKQISAALMALKDIYEWEFEIDNEAKNDKKYDIVFSDKSIPTSDNSLYFFSGTKFWKQITAQNTQNVIYLEDLLKPQNNEWVFNGQLPEFLGNKIIDFYNLQLSKPLTDNELNNIFQIQKYPQKSSNEWFSKSLLLIFILLVGLERWLAITKNA